MVDYIQRLFKAAIISNSDSDNQEVTFMIEVYFSESLNYVLLLTQDVAKKSSANPINCLAF